MKIVLGIVAVMLVGGGAVFMLASGSTPMVTAAADGTVQAVRIEQPEHGDLVEAISAPGEVEPRRKVSISARVPGRIMELPFKEGDRVTGGPNGDAATLVRLDASDLEAALRSAQAQRAAQEAQINVSRARLDAQRASIDGIEANLREARRDLARQEQLYGTQDVSQSIVDTARKRVAELEAQLASAQHALKADELNITVMELNLKVADADIARARENLDHTVITAPIDGTVTRLNAEVGELVVIGTMNNAGTVIMEVADLSQMIFVAQVDEADIGAIKVGQQAEMMLRAYPDQIFTGKVESIALKHDPSPNGGKFFKTKIAMDTGDQRIYSGLTGDAHIETKRHANVLMVPTQAVLGRRVDELPADIRKDNEHVNEDKTHTVVVYRFIDGKAVVTPVTIGATDVTHTAITGGLSAEDRIITGPYKVLESLAHDQVVKDESKTEDQKSEARDQKSSNSDS